MKTLLKLLAAWVVFGVAFVAGGMLVWMLHLRVNVPIDHIAFYLRLLTFAAGGAVLVVGLWPLARGLAASTVARATVLGAFLFLALGTNTIFDGAIYSSSFDGSIASSLLTFLVLALLLGSALGAEFGGQGNATGFARHGVVALGGRAVLAFLAWPFIYLAFGAMIAPIVMPYYQSGVVAGLHIPPMQTILAVQLVRSLIFLASSLPLIVLWRGTRGSLWFALGLAHTVAIGLFGLTLANFLPAVLRITHSAEIACDSFAYAGLLVLLFAAPQHDKGKAPTAGSLAQGMHSPS